MFINFPKATFIWESTLFDSPEYKKIKSKKFNHEKYR
jgi:hypothetical protein